MPMKRGESLQTDFFNWEMERCKVLFSREKGMIDVPLEFLVSNIVVAVFSDFNGNRCNSIILTAKNVTSLKLNDEILHRLPGKEHTFLIKSFVMILRKLRTILLSS